MHREITFCFICLKQLFKGSVSAAVWLDGVTNVRMNKETWFKWRLLIQLTDLSLLLPWVSGWGHLSEEGSDSRVRHVTGLVFHLLGREDDLTICDPPRHQTHTHTLACVPTHTHTRKQYSACAATYCAGHLEWHHRVSIFQWNKRWWKQSHVSKLQAGRLERRSGQNKNRKICCTINWMNKIIDGVDVEFWSFSLFLLFSCSKLESTDESVSFHNVAKSKWNRPCVQWQIISIW